jgi:hypothetical protein
MQNAPFTPCVSIRQRHFRSLNPYARNDQHIAVISRWWRKYQLCRFEQIAAQANKRSISIIDDTLHHDLQLERLRLQRFKATTMNVLLLF